ncbi:MAG: lipid A deacylase LpxR family protein, partial [Bacteroidia bacterium]|nr:lipid A deacylase LpxR family protein [Bacteroidia bacterium]
DGFTPRSITYTTIRYDERPYCGLLFLSHGLTSINAKKKLLLYTQLDLGVMGYITGGEAEQKAIHKAINGDQPLGWENQIKTDAAINYRAKLEKGILVTKHLEFMLNSTARVGSLYTDIGVGAHARVGVFNSYFANLGLQKHTVKNKFKIYLTTKLNTTLVGYNATMQGGLFNSKSILEVPTTNINRNVHAAYLGITVGYKRFSLEYNRTFITPEFKGGLYHGWGGLTINVCF